MGVGVGGAAAEGSPLWPCLWALPPWVKRRRLPGLFRAVVTPEPMECRRVKHRQVSFLRWFCILYNEALTVSIPVPRGRRPGVRSVL
jgi:hypothetical protein